MAKCQLSFTTTGGKVSAVELVDGEPPDGNWVVGWGMGEREEVLIVAFSPGPGDTTLTAKVSTQLSPRVKLLDRV